MKKETTTPPTKQSYVEPVGFKGTHGKWIVDHRNNGIHIESIGMEQQESYAVEVATLHGNEKVDEIDAKLISQSKELAKALQDSTKHFLELCYAAKVWEHIGVSEEWLRKQIETNNQVLKEAGLTNE